MAGATRTSRLRPTLAGPPLPSPLLLGVRARARTRRTKIRRSRSDRRTARLDLTATGVQRSSRFVEGERARRGISRARRGGYPGGRRRANLTSPSRWLAAAARCYRSLRPSPSSMPSSGITSASSTADPPRECDCAGAPDDRQRPTMAPVRCRSARARSDLDRSWKGFYSAVAWSPPRQRARTRARHRNGSR